MAKKDPLTFQRGRQRFPTMPATLKVADNKPHIGVTQGGSSRSNSGARVAANNGLYKKPRRRSRNG